ncbi:MAG: transcriptional regulator, partial [Mesorhizobium sp.]
MVKRQQSSEVDKFKGIEIGQPDPLLVLPH